MSALLYGSPIKSLPSAFMPLVYILQYIIVCLKPNITGTAEKIATALFKYTPEASEGARRDLSAIDVCDECVCAFPVLLCEGEKQSSVAGVS